MKLIRLLIMLLVASSFVTFVSSVEDAIDNPDSTEIITQELESIDFETLNVEVEEYMSEMKAARDATRTYIRNIIVNETSIVRDSRNPDKPVPLVWATEFNNYKHNSHGFPQKLNNSRLNVINNNETSTSDAPVLRGTVLLRVGSFIRGPTISQKSS